MLILGILGHVIVDWHTKKHKKRRFLAWKFISNSHITQKPLGVQSWNLDTMWVLRNAFCKPSLGAPGLVTKILQAENGQKVDEFEPIYLSNYRCWWKIVCDFEHTFDHLCFGYVRLPHLENYFSCFVSFFLTFFFILLALATFKPLNALYSKFERLKISGTTFVRLKSGVPGCGDPQSDPQRFLTFKLLKLDGSNFRNGQILKIN